MSVHLLGLNLWDAGGGIGSMVLTCFAQAEDTTEWAARRAVRSWSRCLEYFARGAPFCGVAEPRHGLEDSDDAFWRYELVCDYGFAC